MNRIPAVLVHFRMSSSVGRGTRIIGAPHAITARPKFNGSVPDNRASSQNRRTLEPDALALDDDPPRLNVEHAVNRRRSATLRLPAVRTNSLVLTATHLFGRCAERLCPLHRNSAFPHSLPRAQVCR